jgi:hypothetical protein
MVSARFAAPEAGGIQITSQGDHTLLRNSRNAPKKPGFLMLFQTLLSYFLSDKSQAVFMT